MIRRLCDCLLAAMLVVSASANADSITGQDKVNHFAVSASLATLTTKTHGVAQGLALALIPGLVKEVSDLGGSGTPSGLDIVANFAGAITAASLPEGMMIVPIANNGAFNGAQLVFYWETIND